MNNIRVIVLLAFAGLAGTGEAEVARRVRPVVIEDCCCLNTDGILSPAYLFDSVVTNMGARALHKGPYISRLRGFVDLDLDGHEDVLLSAPECSRGTGGLGFDLFLWTNGNYRCIGDLGGDPSNIRVEDEPDGHRRIWSYWHCSCRTGSFANVTVWRNGWIEKGQLPVSFATDEGEPSIAAALEQAIHRHATVPIRWERSVTVNGTNVWVRYGR